MSLIPGLGKQRHVDILSLVYRARFRIARATQRNLVLKNQKKEKEKRKKKNKEERPQISMVESHSEGGIKQS